MQTHQETDGGLKKKIQHECEHDGKDDRACHVKRRQDTQREQTTEKERLGICVSSAASVAAAYGFGRSTSSIDGKGGRCDGGMAATIGFASECERMIAFDDHHTRLADPGSSQRWVARRKHDQE